MLSRTDLGTLVTTHYNDNPGRRRLGVTLTVLSSLGFGIGFTLSINGVYGSVTELVMLFGCAGLATGVRSLVRAVRGGNDERFAVHARGIAYTGRRGTCHWRWEDIAFVRVRRNRVPDPFARYTGSPLEAEIHLRTGRRVIFDATTDAAESLVAVIQAHCDPAPRRSWRERARWLYLILGALAVMAALVAFVVPVVDGRAGVVTMVWAIGACAGVVVYGLLMSLRRG
ncbi:PH domain-containing protein [Actinokineospora auranticolor]|uniref:PH (Pleckstrin Homology) domain-containing protein n=1 Tax=Actinokineospora auranticolor TaxID=155976 RepID=A0A2S6GEN0_9PSEU|nr:PH domain-containing protein [Actinokineospora auranticolor]PPK63689.1 PH (Pleckstrin Homology) domain-containing protein [Actinokineospora auranticolor]